MSSSFLLFQRQCIKSKARHSIHHVQYKYRRTQRKYSSISSLRSYSILNHWKWNGLCAIRKHVQIQSKIGISVFGTGLSFGCYHVWLSNRHRSVMCAAKPSMDEGNVSDEEWIKVAHEMNMMGHNLKRCLHLRMFEYIIMIGLVFCFGIGLLLWPLWRWKYVNQTIKRLKIGKLRCRLRGTFGSYVSEVVLPHYVFFGIITFGLYPLFGFAYHKESHWFDSHTQWYIPQQRKKEENI